MPRRPYRLLYCFTILLGHMVELPEENTDGLSSCCSFAASWAGVFLFILSPEILICIFLIYRKSISCVGCMSDFGSFIMNPRFSRVPLCVPLDSAIIRMSSIYI